MAKAATKTTRKPAARRAVATPKEAEPEAQVVEATSEPEVVASPEPAKPAPASQGEERVRFDDTKFGAPPFDLIGRQARRDAKTKRLYWLLPKDLAERASRHNHVTTGRIVRAQ